MITAFTVKNFKAIGEEPARIEFKPITLLFGANSAGKSSILHALNYAYSVFNDRNPNAEYNAHGSSIFNLGGFKRFVHNNDLNRSIFLRFELDFKAENDIPDYFLNNFTDLPEDFEEPYTSIPMLKPRAILAKVKNVFIEVEISWSYEQGRPYVSKYSTGLNGTWIASICSEGYKKKNYICGFNIIHPVFNNLWTIHGILMDRLISLCIEPDKLKNAKWYNNKRFDAGHDKLIDRRRAIKRLGRVPVDFSISEKIALDLYNQNDALPEFLLLSSRKLIFGNIWRDPDYLDISRYYDDSYRSDHPYFEIGCPIYSIENHWLSGKKIVKRENKKRVAAVTVVLEDFFNSVLLAPGLKVTNWLNSTHYLGPLREIPSRNFLGEISEVNSENNARWRWEKGTAAWDLLYHIGRWKKELKIDKSQIDDWIKENFEEYYQEILSNIYYIHAPHEYYYLDRKLYLDKYLPEIPHFLIRNYFDNYFSRLTNRLTNKGAEIDKCFQHLNLLDKPHLPDLKKLQEFLDKDENWASVFSDILFDVYLKAAHKSKELTRSYYDVEPLARLPSIYRLHQKEELDRISRLCQDELLNEIASKKIASMKYGDELLSKINNWLSSDQRLNTGYEVIIERFREISSVIFKDFDEEKSQENVFVLLKKILNEPEIIRIWLRDISRSINLKPHEIGTGISQVLPVVVAAVGVDASLMVIEQPELHIHPAMQVQLGDLFITQSNENKFFMIETHSEHLLLRILRRIRETADGKAPEEAKLLPNEVAVYYVESESGSTQVNRIGLDENGRFTDRWPRGFFEEREKEYFGEQQDLSDELGRLFGK